MDENNVGTREGVGINDKLLLKNAFMTDTAVREGGRLIKRDKREASCEFSVNKFFGDDETKKKLGFDKICSHLQSPYRNYVGDYRFFEDILGTGWNDLELIRARQELFGEMVEMGNEDLDSLFKDFGEKTQEGEAKISRLVWVISGSHPAWHPLGRQSDFIETWTEQAKMVRENLLPAYEETKKQWEGRNFESDYLNQIKQFIPLIEPEVKEIDRILREPKTDKDLAVVFNDLMTSKIRNENDKLREFEKNMEKVYQLVGLGKCILDKNWGKRELTSNDDEGLELYGVDSLSIDNFVPFDIKFKPGCRAIVVTGDNGTGKTILGEAISVNEAATQATGYGPCKKSKGKIFSEVVLAKPIPEIPGETQYSRGEIEMRYFVDIMNNLKPGALLIMDEVLTSTDSMGALSLLMACIEKKTQEGSYVILMIHSRLLEKLYEADVVSGVQYIRAVEGEDDKKTYKWEEGVGVADALKLAKRMGLSDELVNRARKIQGVLEK